MKRFSLLGWKTVQLIFFEVIKPSSLLGWSTVEFCLFRCNNVELSVQMGNGSVCWDVLRNEVGMEQSLAFCKVNRFSAFCYTTRLGWNSCVCVCGNAIV